MPAVAQISVDFANQNNIVGDGLSLQSSVKAISPLTLSRYCLYSREKNGIGENFGAFDVQHLNYNGGFITAGDKINYKHSDLQVRGNLDLEKGVYVDSIYSRRKETSDNSYQNGRSSIDRAVKISALDSEASTSFISINSTSATKTTTLKAQQAATNNSIVLNSTSSGTNSITLESNNIDITGIVKSENNTSTVWVKSMPTEVATALRNRDYNNAILTNNYNSVNVRDLVSEIVGTKPPVYWNQSTDGSTLTLQNKYDNQTIIITGSTTVTVLLPSGLREGLQVSFVRAGSGDVVLTQSGSTILSSPQNTFRKLAFTNSVATCLLASGDRYFIFGDLLPVT